MSSSRRHGVFPAIKLTLSILCTTITPIFKIEYLYRALTPYIIHCTFTPHRSIRQLYIYTAHSHRTITLYTVRREYAVYPVHLYCIFAPYIHTVQSHRTPYIYTAQSHRTPCICTAHSQRTFIQYTRHVCTFIHTHSLFSLYTLNT